MSPDRAQFLDLRRLPARLNSEEVAYVLGFSTTDVPILTAAALLKPIGKPANNAPRYYARATIEELATDIKWLNRASIAISDHWRRHNLRNRRVSRDGDQSPVAAVDAG